MSTFSYDNYIDLIVYPDGRVEADNGLPPDIQKDVDDTLQRLLDVLAKYPDGSLAEDAIIAMSKIKQILFDIEENPDDYEEYE